MDTEIIEYLKILVDRDLSQAEDNLSRAGIAFKGQNLDLEYGQSGRTRREIISDYSDARNIAYKAREELKSAECIRKRRGD